MSKGYYLEAWHAEQRETATVIPLHSKMLWRHPSVAIRTSYKQPRVLPVLVMILQKGIRSGARPGERWRAVGGYFLGMHVFEAAAGKDSASPRGFFLDEVMFASPAVGTLRLFHDDRPITEASDKPFGDIEQKLATVVEQVGHLEEGQMVVLGASVPAQAVASGVLRLEWNHHVFVARIS